MISSHPFPSGGPLRGSAYPACLPDIVSAPSSLEATPLGGVDDAVDRRLTVKIGFLGLGKLGGLIVRCLIESGHDVTVWNRTPSKVR